MISKGIFILLNYKIAMNIHRHKKPKKYTFYCATIAYHVGLSALFRGRWTPAND